MDYLDSEGVYLLLPANLRAEGSCLSKGAGKDYMGFGPVVIIIPDLF